jgi:hypothetical protein
MPRRDHYRSPVNDTHSWDEVHGQWPGEIVRHLSTILPDGFRAAPKVHLGSPFEVDVSTYDLDARAPDTTADSSDGGTGTLTALSPTLTVEADRSEQDEYEVRIYDTLRGRLSTTTPYLYAVTLRSRKPPKRRPLFDAWFYPMTIGQPLPTQPIWLSPDLRVMLPLETSYDETCRILGIA